MKNYGVRFGSGDPRTYTGLTPTFLLFLNMASQTTVAPPGITEVIASSGLYTFQWGATTPIAFLIDANSTAPGNTGRYVTGTLDPADRSDEYGNSLMAYGASILAIGTTNFALGTTNVALGTTNVALGTTNVALGTSNVAIGNSITAQGVTLTALGLTTLRLAQLTQSDTQALLLVTGELGDTLIAIGNTIAQGFSFQIAGIGSTASSFGDSTTMPTNLFGYLKRIQENLEGNSSYNKVGGAFTISSRGSSVVLASKTITNSVTTVIKT